jgi:hypothetical protein
MGYDTKPSSHKQTMAVMPSCADFNSDHFHPNNHLNPMKTGHFIDLSFYQHENQP